MLFRIITKTAKKTFILSNGYYQSKKNFSIPCPPLLTFIILILVLLTSRKEIKEENTSPHKIALHRIPER
jgi:hypothetical protein